MEAAVLEYAGLPMLNQFDRRRMLGDIWLTDTELSRLIEAYGYPLSGEGIYIQWAIVGILEAIDRVHNSNTTQEVVELVLELELFQHDFLVYSAACNPVPAISLYALDAIVNSPLRFQAVRQLRPFAARDGVLDRDAVQLLQRFTWIILEEKWMEG